MFLGHRDEQLFHQNYSHILRWEKKIQRRHVHLLDLPAGIDTHRKKKVNSLQQPTIKHWFCNLKYLHAFRNMAEKHQRMFLADTMLSSYYWLFKKSTLHHHSQNFVMIAVGQNSKILLGTAW